MAHPLYNRRQWRDLRGEVLTASGWSCALCGSLLMGKPNMPTAPVVDHIIPHRGSEALFFDRANLQALCKACHDRHKQREEKSGAVLGCDLSGEPFGAV